MGIVAKQGIYNALSLIFGFGIGAFTQLVVLKWLEKEGDVFSYYGMITLMISWALLFAQILNFGSAAIAVRFGPSYKSAGNEHFSLFYAWIFPLIGLVALILFFLFAGNWFIDSITKEELVEPFYLLGFLILLVIPMTFFKSLSGIAISQFKTSLVGFLNEIAIRVFVLAGIAAYFLNLIDIKGLFISTLVAYTLQFLILWIYLGHFNLFRFGRPDRKNLREAVTYGSFSVMDSGANLLANKIDVLMIGAMLGFNEVNYYNFAFFAATVITIPGRSLANISSSVVADSFHRNDWKNIESLYKKNSLNQLITGGFIFVVLYAGIDSLVDYMPAAFQDAKYVFLYLGIAKIFDLLTSINGPILQITPHYRYNFYFNSVLVVLVIITNLIMIPLYGIIGAALATAVCVFVSNILKTYFLYKKYKVHPFDVKMIYAFICLGIPLIIGIMLPDFTENAMFNFIIKASIAGCIALPIIWFANLSEEIRNLGYLIFSKIGIKKNG